MATKTKAKARAQEAQHTPGPWEFVGQIDARSWGWIRAGRVQYQGALHSPAVARVCKRSLDLGYDEATANARLIAAAPELLQLLQEFVAGYETAPREFGKALEAQIARHKDIAVRARAVVRRATEPTP